MRALFQAAVLMLLIVPVRSQTTFEWRRGPEVPSARDHLGCGVVDGLFVVAGGAYWEGGKKQYTTETIAYSAAVGKWVRLPYLPRPGAYGASAVIRDRRGSEQLLIAGGANEDGATSACYRLVKVNGVFCWKPLPSLPRPLVGARCAAIGNKFYIFGGATGIDEAGIRSSRPSLLELEVFNMPGGASRWKEISIVGAPAGSAGRVGSAVAASDGRLFVFGGYGVQPDGTLGNFGDAYVLDLSRGVARKWMRLKDMPIPSRWTTALGLDWRYVGLFGGYGEKGVLDNVLIYDTEQGVYLPCANLPQALAVMAGGLAEDGTVYLAGGEDKERHRSAALFIGRLKGSE